MDPAGLTPENLPGEIFSVHLGNGLFMSNNGYEFGLALLAVSISLMVSGAGRASLDGLLAGSSSHER